MIKLNDEILLNVQRPQRYIGEEINIIKKSWDDDKVKVCLCYPDAYEIGMSHLGLKVLYHILNKRADVLCERSFAPWPDMENILRGKGIALFSLENKMPLGSFDIIGFSLQYELTYTNILNMLDLSGVPLFSSERLSRKSPIVIAGGSCAFNPEPLADFIDIFVIGDGEEAVIDIIEAYKRSKISDKEVFLKEASKIEGVYIPSLYEISYDGSRIKSIAPKYKDMPEKIRKRTVRELRSEDFPARPIVPYLSTIHDRITLEIMRGCPNQCRFCQARPIYAPVRIRKKDDIINLAKETYKNTGLDEVSLLSLSSSNYPEIEKLCTELISISAPLGIGISLPSLRAEEELDKLPSLISIIKKSGLTFAPEAGTEKMLSILGKEIKYGELFKVLREAYLKGWQKIKLYFMIGLPSEDKKDLEAIIKLAEEAALLRTQISKGPAEVTVNISSFIPKPHTVFQWLKMEGPETLKSKQGFLKGHAAGKRYLKLKFHNVESSLLEGAFSRGDRRLSRVLFDAWKSGARFDAWKELFNFSTWEEAFLKNGIDKNSYLKERDPDETLPWEHISCGIDKNKLFEEFKNLQRDPTASSLRSEASG